MENKETKKKHSKEKKPTYVCVCNMEWRGVGGEPDNDCICYCKD